VQQLWALQVLPAVPLASAGLEQASAESGLVHMLLHHAIPEATADMPGKLQAIQQQSHNLNQSPVCNQTQDAVSKCVAAAGSILLSPGIKQLLQLLEQLQLRHGRLAGLQVSKMASNHDNWHAAPTEMFPLKLGSSE